MVFYGRFTDGKYSEKRNAFILSKYEHRLIVKERQDQYFSKKKVNISPSQRRGSYIRLSLRL